VAACPVDTDGHGKRRVTAGGGVAVNVRAVAIIVIVVDSGTITEMIPHTWAIGGHECLPGLEANLDVNPSPEVGVSIGRV